MSLISLLHRTSPVRNRRPKAFRYSLVLEGLEERTVMSHVVAAPAPPPAQVAAAAAPTLSLPIKLTGLNITGLTTNAQGAITGATGVVTGTLLGQTFSTPLAVTATPTANPNVPVLDLALAPINLNLLGLNLTTSAICLDVTAHPGKGNLLGNLVADVANLLNGPAPANPTALLGNITNLLTTVTSGQGHHGSSSLLGLLNSATGSALGGLGSPSLSNNAAASPCPILNLNVGPLDLDLLGLEVKLDNCNNGPVNVTLTATPGPGNLLGNLLCDLTGLLNQPGGLTLNGLVADLNQILTTLKL